MANLVIPKRELPTELKQANQNITDFSCLFLGEKTTGKTSLFAQYPKHFILEFEIGNAKHINGNWENVPDWETYVHFVDRLVANPGYCSIVVHDGFNKLDSYAYNYSRKLFKYQPTDKDEFEIWRTKKEIVITQYNRLKAAGYVTGFTAHTEVKTVTDIKGKEISKLQADISGQAREMFNEMDIAVWGVMHRDRNNQVLMQIVGDSFVQASHKLINHFRWNGYQIKNIPLGFSPETAFQNFNLAFNNQLQVDDENLIKSAPQATPAPPKLVLKKSE